MTNHKAYRFRIYPNREQRILIAKTIGSTRFVYNHFLAKWNDRYKETGKGMSYNASSAELPQLKRDYEWLKEVDSTALQQGLKHLADGFNRFIKKQNKYPRFKSKKNDVQSFKTVGQMRIEGNRLFLPKLGYVKFAKSRHVEGRILSATIRRTPMGKHFISVLAETEVKPFDATGSAVGIDLGIDHFAILSDGQKIDNERFTRKMEQKLKREQRKLSRRYEQAKKDGKPLREAKNYQKQKVKVAKIHEKIANQRTDFLQKLSTTIIKNHDVVCIEDLNAKGMLKNKKLSKAISDVSWSSFKDMLMYKAEWHDRTIIKIDRWFPSSQLCSSCGHHDGKKDLRVRSWTCPSCGTHHDRDINASRNILQEGLRVLS
ncbi:IS200/IS605 family element RNA-guided endonuclease TnpB [Salisediminibacterium selenitireducens]|uniref:Transposase, IS605 OrfB family n=1 Tax=Bacillus selenitireducens (strain ATCC 700615 / DSM 15326 / MLS10) TaxID=439292 RepID=D6XXT7_BACIE|nr:IS200/IS605 family element RNA-guided endonuclease TnpB [Salisediminibacterium selenitireducens]ADI00130.1 transposase, IS605 OrfB family [[Bacillus] selenitireducens MLS10]